MLEFGQRDLDTSSPYKTICIRNRHIQPRPGLPATEPLVPGNRSNKSRSQTADRKTRRGLSWPADDGPSPSRKEAADYEHKSIRLQSPIRARDTHSDDDRDEEQCELTYARLRPKLEKIGLSSKCRDVHLRMFSILTDIGDEQLPAMQALIDDVPWHRSN